MYVLSITGRIASDLCFYKYHDKDYCVVSLECDEYTVDRSEPIICIIPCDNIETMKQELHKGDYICGDGRVDRRRDYKGDMCVYIDLDNVARYFIGKRGEHHEKDRF